jgi:hypothetical protein
MKNAVFWDMAPCRSCVNRRFEGTSVYTRSRRRHIREDGILLWMRIVRVSADIRIGHLPEHYDLNQLAGSTLFWREIRSPFAFEMACTRVMNWDRWRGFGRVRVCFKRQVLSIVHLCAVRCESLLITAALYAFYSSCSESQCRVEASWHLVTANSLAYLLQVLPNESKVESCTPLEKLFFCSS